MKSRWWYGYIIDLCKRDALALLEKPMPLKDFRLKISPYLQGCSAIPLSHLFSQGRGRELIVHQIICGTNTPLTSVCQAKDDPLLLQIQGAVKEGPTA
ncbi:hypothetical protein Pmani_017905 [Petrolisthes manimaculis]|uniref:Uncharacterized protein n=1 Tax=Petrolisthes manimaculis TaxID=1843537 RepID=A0AAE1U4Z9_9EUCA|nr:hypothetical protein Pmani_017905 [Petrolisthes manimaculis]